MASPAYLNFNTKSCLAQVVQNIPKICAADPDTVSPRTYRMHRDKEANLFYRDYLFTACCSLLKTVTSSGQLANEPSVLSPLTWTCRRRRGIPRKFPLSSRLQKPELQNFDPNSECYSCHPDVFSSEITSWLTRTSFDIPPVKDLEKGHLETSMILPDEVVRMAACHVVCYLEVEDEILYADRLDKMVFVVAPDDDCWNSFIHWTYLMKLRQNSSNTSIKLEEIEHTAQKIKYCRRLLDCLYVVNPQCQFEGQKNIWIIKPGSKSRGMEITVSDLIEEITEICYNHQGYPDMRNFIVQKYIERPFLCYNTKFDIRQWFLVTWHPLKLWMYQDCYLRFGSSEFSLTDFNEKIHLTNNAVQGKYFDAISPESKIPKECMWRKDEFLTYLSEQGLDGHTVWDEKIFPEITRLLTLALVTSAVQMDKKAINGYELFGADFIVTEDLKPWLIEINSGPDLHPTTSVTATLCPEVIIDCIKVVIDNLRNRSPDTGKFRLAFQLNYSRRHGKAFRVRSFPLEALKPIRGHRQRIAKSRMLFQITKPGNFILRTLVEMNKPKPKESAAKPLPFEHYSTYNFIRESVKNLRRIKAMRRFRKRALVKMQIGTKEGSTETRKRKSNACVRRSSSTSTDHDSSSTSTSKDSATDTTAAPDSESLESNLDNEKSEKDRVEAQRLQNMTLRKRTMLRMISSTVAVQKAPSPPVPRAVDKLRLDELAQPKSITLIRRWESGRISRKKKLYSGLLIPKDSQQLVQGKQVLGDNDMTCQNGQIRDTQLPQTLEYSHAALPNLSLASRNAGHGDVSTGSLSKYYISAAVQREIDQYVSEPAQNLRLHMTLRNALRRYLPKSGHWIKLIDGFIRNPNNNTLKAQTRNLMHSIMMNQMFVTPSEIFRTFEKLAVSQTKTS
ncbi:uncharacterized protein LOC129597700 isoform X2 [Paramacrobiotus metropolitanus]|nr:uncharacterized protein LOC129597700 isoform X2 [Paramacrobiotus metropolitanus]XP_055351323.1 uncharacterized protein LOC129597700 isoform X2 [Paramacrobiotus metropolitanus]XP_055351324.1 uncharacterized protein LOC129597700 isoform X2 [Paramacrobiotus metropolitanus]XP_055351325.1 uncharacterized protein LOC129597700 isoform X2 [Paramacrobiotus metropolitanus]